MKQTVTIKLTVGNPTSVRIMQVNQVNNELIAISHLGGLNGPAPDVVAQVSDFVQVETSSNQALPVKHYVIKSLNSPKAFVDDSKLINLISSEKEITEPRDEKNTIYRANSNNFVVNNSKVTTDIAYEALFPKKK